MRRSLRLCLMLGLSVCGMQGSRSFAEPPAQQPTPAQTGHVRQVGGKRGPTVELSAATQEASRAARQAVWRELKRGLKTPSELPIAVRAELEKHARRMARLQRIRVLAVERHDQPSLARVDPLIARELTRHREQLARVWPAPPPPRKPRAAPPPDDPDDEDKRLDGEGEDDPQEGQ
jgi:hypothetical protein